MKVRPMKSTTRYLSLNLDEFTGIAPDWLLVFLEITRQQKVRNLSPGDLIELRKPIWDVAGITSPNRRKKVVDHLENRIPNEIVQLVRQRGKVPIAMVGKNMAKLRN